MASANKLHTIKFGYAWKATQLFGFVKDDSKPWKIYASKADREAVNGDRDNIDWTNGEKFRVYDDDGELYAHGVLVSGNDFANLFEPLDDFFMGAWGCTELRYKNPKTGKYETL